nr:hypothetical protein [Tanacetum cinerariifolium]
MKPNPSRLLNLCLSIGALFAVEDTVEAAIRCERNLVANVVALDQPLMYNRLGAQNANGMIYALRSDVVDENNVLLTKGGAAVPGKVTLRPDKRPRPMVLRVAAGDCLTVTLQNLLALQANPNSEMEGPEVPEGEDEAQTPAANMPGEFVVNDQ